MMRLKYWLLPIAGALAAFLSFVFASPYVKGLDRGLKQGDPLADTTFGTTWSLVQHSVFGVLLCGFFCFLLEYDRRTPRGVIKATVVGMVLGGILNSVADSGSDYIGILIGRAAGGEGASMVSGLAGFAAWIVLVPTALATSITIAIGVTPQRITRAMYAIGRAGMLVFLTRICSMVYASSKASNAETPGQKLIEFVPLFMLDAVAAAVVLGIILGVSDRIIRRGSLRLIYGHKEYKDWSLDHGINRIGSGEVEISVRGFKGVEPVHSCIFRQGDMFLLDSQHFPAFVNGHPAVQAPLNHGDMIQIGEAMLVFYAKGAVQSSGQYYAPVQRVPMQPAQPMQGMQPMQPIQPVQGQPVVPIVPVSQPIPQIAAVAPVMMPTTVPQPAPSAPIVMPQPVAPTATTAPDPTPATQYTLVNADGKVYPLTQGVNSVGREAGNAVCFANNSTVSRSHAHIIVDDNGASVSDLRSANGTGVNGAPVTGAVALADGDTVAFGSENLTFRIG